MGIAGAAGSLAPVVIGAAVAGKVLGVLGAAAAAVTYALNRFADAAINATLRVSKYDARLASAGAMLDIGRTMRDIRMAQATSRTGSELLMAQDRNEQAWAPISHDLQNMMNQGSKHWLDLKFFLTTNIAGPIVTALKTAVEISGNMFDQLVAIAESMPLVGDDIQAIRKSLLKQIEDARRAAEDDRRKANQAFVNNMNHMLDAAARRAPF
jgi:hypothetical protein